MKPVRIAVVGLGGISQSVHLPVIQRNRAHVELVALVELSASRLATMASRYGVEDIGLFATATELAAAIADSRIDVDAAIVATPGGHADDALILIRAGVRVLAEKPLAYSFAELGRLEDSLQGLGLHPQEWLRVGYMKEHDPAVAQAKALLSSVDVREVSIEVLHPADDKQIRFANLGAPAVDVDPATLLSLQRTFEEGVSAAIGAGGGDQRRLYTNVLLGSIVHDLALTRHLGFGLEHVHHATRYGPRFPGTVIAAGRARGDVPFSLRWHFISDYPEYRETVTFHHERGSIELEFKTPYILNAPTVLRTFTNGDDLASSRTETVWPQEEAFERQLRVLMDMTRSTFSPGSSIDAARKDLLSAQSLWRASAKSAGHTVAPACEAHKPSHGNSNTDSHPEHP